jgi:hypothetical protein
MIVVVEEELRSWGSWCWWWWKTGERDDTELEEMDFRDSEPKLQEADEEEERGETVVPTAIPPPVEQSFLL